MKIGKIGSQDIDISFWQVLRFYLGIELIATVILLVIYVLAMLALGLL